ncbi:MAG TPA: hypothetical protein VJ997_13255, partial [Longimicrobiales bacterium]|nr:hypothetical protein [Longimicrobiales bacterium]
MFRRVTLFSTVLLVLATSAVAAQQVLGPLDVFEVEYVQDPQISPDGSQVVYVRQSSDIMTDRNYTNLWIVGTDGSNHRPLTTGDFSDASPRWSPDGSKVAFISDRDGTEQIWVRFMDSGEIARITNLRHAPAGITWSPDGTQLAFTGLVPDAPAQVAKLPAPPEGATWAAPARTVDDLVYRFNGPGYLDPGFVHLFVVPAEGGTPRQISHGNFQHGGVFRASDAVWTPDGRYLVMSANRHADWETEPLDTDVWEFSVADGAARRLTDRRGPDNGPAV